MVEWAALEMRCTGDCTGGSNPSLSANALTCNKIEPPIESVSKMLGHKSIKMTQHYAKVLEKTVVREMGELAGKLNYVAV